MVALRFFRWIEKRILVLFFCLNFEILCMYVPLFALVTLGPKDSSSRTGEIGTEIYASPEQVSTPFLTHHEKISDH